MKRPTEIGAAFLRRVALGLAGVLLCLPAAAQMLNASPPTPNRYPSPLPRRRAPEPPPLTFRPRVRIPLPGPLAEDPPRRLDDRIRIHTAEGDLDVDPSTTPPTVGPPEIPAARGTAEVGSWVVSSDGRHRYRTLPGGTVEGQRRSRWFRHRWRKVWKLRAPGATPSPPLVFGRRVCFGGLSDLVTCVRAKNGHQLWSVDVGGRVSRPLALWRGPVPIPDDATGKAVEVTAILVVPDRGTGLLALDPYNGKRLASFSPPGTGGRFLAPALVLSGGKIAVAVQGYEPGDAALLLVKLDAAPAGEEEKKSKIIYNEPRAPAAAHRGALSPNAGSRSR